VEVLFDERADSPGVKFNDADLIGLPIRVTVGARSLKEGNIELKRRDQNERLLIPIGEAIETIKVVMSDLESEVMATVIEMPMKV
jgi:prolyl-tRNA synthetase